jgi:amino acid adenylation domain-containing protein/thioester reductase-like protein
MVHIGMGHEGAAPESPWSRSGDSYIVAVNGEEQHAIWPAALNLPAGWRQRSQPMSSRACLTAIAAAWTDIAPASLRGTAPSGTAPPGTAPRYVQDLFDEQANRRPGSIVVDAGATKLTYRQLARSANQLAHQLREIGVGPEVLVGVALERGPEAVRCQLAIMKAGGGYLPLDPALPAGRLGEMCAEAKPAIIITASSNDDRTEDHGADGHHTDDRGAAAFACSGAALLQAADLAVASAGQPTTAPATGLRPDNVAYAIYTSGSTGRPKGVAVSHSSLARQIQDVAHEYQISPGDRVLQLASLAFDTSVEQTLVTLLSGATLLLPPPGTIGPTDLLRYLAEQRATVVDLTPAYWHQLLAITEPDDDKLTALRLMITGGEVASATDCQAALRAARGARLVNAYGLTETTITSTLHDICPVAADAEPASPVPVGQALPHSRVLLLDEHLKPVPDDTVGEIYIGGEGVARGYVGQPGRTAERFVPDPHSPVPGSRMYRTGDLGRWPDGRDLVVIGRADRQLKVRGYRIEPAEIESALTAHPAIRQATVVAHEISPGNTQLTAYYVRRTAGGKPASPGSGRGHHQLSGECLRAFLGERLPQFMIPAEFVALHQIPRTPDGEINREALTYPVARGSEGAGEERYTPTQAGLSHLWSRILYKERVGLDDDFFALGGNSLLAAEMLAHTRVMFGIGTGYVRPLTRCLLRDATLRGFSAATQAARAGKLSATSSDPHIDFAHEAELYHPFRPVSGPPPEWRQPRQVFLTGATGFFGAHLLSELLASTAADVHCLVRARDASHALRRITQTASRYSVDGLDLSRIVPVVGDLSEPRFGLPPSTFGELARSSDAIYHVGALVNFIYPYADLRSANVTGTREVIRLASMYRRIPVHYVSTTAVLAGFGAMGVREVTEDTPLAYADHLGIGYVETKFVAEELLRKASEAGLPVAIYRPLDIVGDLRSGTWNTATEMCALIRFMTDTGLAPDIDLPLDFVPADVCAAAVGYISTHIEAGGETYHLSSPAYALLSSLVGRLEKHGFQIESIPYSEWVGALVRHAADNPGHPMTPFVPLFVDHCAGSELTVAEMYLEHVFPSYTRTHLEQALAGSGIAFPAVDAALFDLAIGRLLEIGYLRTHDAGQLLPGLGLVRDHGPRGGLPGRLLRRPEPGQRAWRLPARDRSAPGGQRVFPRCQRVPVRRGAGRRTDRCRGRHGGRPVPGNLVVSRSETGDRRWRRASGTQCQEATAANGHVDDREPFVPAGRRTVPGGT